MADVNTSMLVAYSAARMFALVDGVEHYPEFLPWCSGSELKFRDQNVTRATLHINFRGVRQSFTTENLKREPDAMELKLVEGPFKTLHGRWKFTDLSSAGCKVELNLHYEFSSRLLDTLIGPVFSHIANTLVDAFVKRAQRLYG